MPACRRPPWQFGGMEAAQKETARRSLGRQFGWFWGAYAVSTFGTWLTFDAFSLIAILVLHAGPAEPAICSRAGATSSPTRRCAPAPAPPAQTRAEARRGGSGGRCFLGVAPAGHISQRQQSDLPSGGGAEGKALGRAGL